MYKIMPAIFLIITLFTCTTAGKNTAFFEGFEGNKLTVFSIEFIPEDKNSDSQIFPVLMEKLNRRAFIILQSYVSINLYRTKVSASNDQLLNNVIDAVISQGRLIHYSFNENGYCEAFAEYEISGFFKVINDINSQQ